MTSPLIIALDLDLNSAISLTKQLDPKDCQLKIGHQLFTSEGPKCIKRFQEMGFKIFLDLKYHDIPNTVFSAVSSAIDLGVWMINIHSSGGPEMIKAAVKGSGYFSPLAFLIVATWAILTPSLFFFI